jgi:hypothetical protein
MGAPAVERAASKPRDRLRLAHSVRRGMAAGSVPPAEGKSAATRIAR